MDRIRIATRKSALALFQANYIKKELNKFYPNLEVEIISTYTEGDRILDRSLSNIGGKGLFIKELEVLLLEGLADIAVHSIKDIPMKLNEHFEIAAITKRENALDSFVSNNFNSLDSMVVSGGGVVGTSSLRREAQIRANFSGIIVKSLRGNIHTRLNKLDNKEFDAIILASAGLFRLGLADRINIISEDIILPAVGQGSLGIEILKGGVELKSILQVLNDEESAYCVNCERFFSSLLGGSCQVPITGYAKIIGADIEIKGLVSNLDGSLVLRSLVRGLRVDFISIASRLADDLISQGAMDIINSF